MEKKNNVVGVKSTDIVDFHSHILPAADHGSSSVETTLIQLDFAVAHGVSRIIATPHFYPSVHDIESFLRRRNNSYLHLMQRMNDSHPSIRLGAEVLICNGIENMPGLENLFVYGTNTLLLELPFTDFQQEYVVSVERMVCRKIDVVIAHADRYPPANIEKMIEAGARIQLNANALTGIFIKSYIKKWLEQGRVVAIGSDIHHRDKKAYAHFDRAKSRISKYLPYIKSESDTVWNASRCFTD